MKDSLPEPGSFEALLPSSHHTVSIARPFDKCPHTHKLLYLPRCTHGSWSSVTHSTAPVSAVVTRRQCENLHTHNEQTGGGGVKSVSYRRSLATQQQQHHRHDSTSKSPHVVVMQGSILSPSPFYFFVLLPCFPSGTNSRQATRLPGKM